MTCAELPCDRSCLGLRCYLRPGNRVLALKEDLASAFRFELFLPCFNWSTLFIGCCYYRRRSQILCQLCESHRCHQIVVSVFYGTDPLRPSEDEINQSYSFLNRIYLTSHVTVIMLLQFLLALFASEIPLQLRLNDGQMRQVSFKFPTDCVRSRAYILNFSGHPWAFRADPSAFGRGQLPHNFWIRIS